MNKVSLSLLTTVNAIGFIHIFVVASEPEHELSVSKFLFLFSCKKAGCMLQKIQTYSERAVRRRDERSRVLEDVSMTSCVLIENVARSHAMHVRLRKYLLML
ncbi:unnamed protein product [Amoebophrya sp. A120]|nr:unnamed protein product [Amoebophrya sp. A120]|eukprot:GSA120T00023637001.1